jgi:hypothetical protein
VASRADAVSAPRSALDDRRAGSLPGAIRTALSDLYYHSWRLVPANLVWSVVAIAVLVALVASPYGVVAVPFLAVPTLGLFRMTDRIARGRAVSFWDSVTGWRHELWTTLAFGGALGLLGLVLTVNLVSGILADSLLGWGFATLAFWGLIGTWLFAWAAWPLLADPWRAAWPARERLRLAGYLLLAHPVRLAGLGVFLLVLLVASAVAIVALLTVSVAIASLIASRFVLPAADRLDARLAFAARRSLQPAGPPDDFEDGEATGGDGPALSVRDGGADREAVSRA